LFSVYLHRVVRPDNSPDLHDHPWPFWHLILEGGYEEEFFMGHGGWGKRTTIGLTGVPDRLGWSLRCRPLAPGYWCFHRAGFAHRVSRFMEDRKESWSLVVVGLKTRDWGFLNRVSGCWVQWESYINGDRC
jgi:hypothetical protein